MISITLHFATLIAASVLLLQVGLATAGSSHHRHTKKNSKRKMCKDRPGIHCGLIVADGDCGMFTASGESYGNAVCQVSCGRCNEVPNEIFTDQLCYSFAKQVIEVTFSNSMPNLGDWVGIYPDTANPRDLGSPVAWYWLCGDKKNKCKTSVGSVTFPWLPPGNYKAIMSRNRDAAGPFANYGPYASYAESESFEVSRGEMCASRRLAEDIDAGAAVPSSLRGMQQ